jgi:hypothetical protein
MLRASRYAGDELLGRLPAFSTSAGWARVDSAFWCPVFCSGLSMLACVSATTPPQLGDNATCAS